MQLAAEADGAHKGAMRRRAQKGHEREADEVDVFSFEVLCTVPSRGVPQDISHTSNPVCLPVGQGPKVATVGGFGTPFPLCLLFGLVGPRLRCLVGAPVVFVP